MKEMEPLAVRLGVEVTTPATGRRATLVRIHHDAGLSPGSVWSGPEGVVVATKVYGTDGGYATAYLTITQRGVVSTAVEGLGVNPTLFNGPDGRAWSRLSLIRAGRDREPDTVAPLLGRTSWGEPVTTREFAAEFVGWIGHRGYWFQDEIHSDKRPARIQIMEHDPAHPCRPRFRRPIKLALPGRGSARLTADGRLIVVLTSKGGSVLRILNADLKIEQEAAIDLRGRGGIVKPVRVEDDGSATILAVGNDGRVELVTMGVDGDRAVVVASGELPGEPYYVWSVDGPKPDRHAVRFTTEAGNGLLVLGEGGPRSLWCSLDDTAYADRIGGGRVELGWTAPTLHDVVSYDDGYALVVRRRQDNVEFGVVFTPVT